MDSYIPARQPKTVQELLKSDIAHPIALDLLFIKRFGMEWLDWEIEVLVANIEQLGAKNPPDHVLHKLQACRTCHLVDAPWLAWEVWLPCCCGFNNLYPDFYQMQAPTVAESMLAVDCMNRIREDVPWSPEMRAYLGVLHQWDDLLVPQAPLEFVQVDTSDFHLDAEQIKQAWPEVRRAGSIPAVGPAEREQLQRMLDANRYLEESRHHLDEQLKILT